MKKYLFCLALACSATSSGWCQRLPFFTHHVLNPYIYNPAFAGYDQSAVFYLTHRQQWLGVEGAPVSTHLSFHTPVGNNNPLSVGADLVHDRLGVLRNSAFKASAAYMIPLSAEVEHYIKAGFSAGVSLQQYSLFESTAAGDPAIARAAQSGVALDGRFGVHYHYERFNLGLALPHLLTTAANPDGSGGVALDQFSRAIASVNYRFDLGVETNVTFVPTVLYHFSQESASQVEATALFMFQDAFWVGGNYQQLLGYGGMAGFKMKNFRFGYHFGLGGTELAGYSNGTHEAQLSFTIGKKKVIMKRKPRLTQTDNDAIPEAILKKDSRRRRKREKKRQKEEAAVPDRKKLPSEQQPKESFDDDSFKEVEEGIILMPSIKDVIKSSSEEEINPQVSPGSSPRLSDPNAVPADSNDGSYAKPDQPELNNTFEGEGNVDPWQGIEDESQATPPPSFDKSVEKAITTVKTVKSGHPLEMPGGIYIIAGTFSQRAYAERLARELAQQGYRTKVGYNTSKGYFYVSLFESDELEEVTRRLYRARNNPKLQKAWVLVVE
ncbi:MAG: PorP/SprF family type IX secretion system membrane protein [Tunicatimonas sp.]